MAGVAVDVRVLVPQVIDAMGHQLPLACGAKIMVKGFHGLRRAGRARAVKIPQSFLLFRVDRNHRIAGCLLCAPQARNVFEWRVAVEDGAPSSFSSVPCGGLFFNFLRSRRMVRRLAGVPRANGRRDNSRNDRLSPQHPCTHPIPRPCTPATNGGGALY